MPPSPSHTIEHAGGGDEAPLFRVRQAAASTVTVVAGSDGSSPGLSSGAIVGIVIGSIVGFLLLLWWFVRCCLYAGTRPYDERGSWHQSRESSARRRRHHRDRDRYYVAYNGEPVSPPRTYSRHSRHHRGPSIEVYRKSGSVVEPVPVVVRSTSRGRSSVY